MRSTKGHSITSLANVFETDCVPQLRVLPNIIGSPHVFHEDYPLHMEVMGVDIGLQIRFYPIFFFCGVV